MFILNVLTYCKDLGQFTGLQICMGLESITHQGVLKTRHQSGDQQNVMFENKYYVGDNFSYK